MPRASRALLRHASGGWQCGEGVRVSGRHHLQFLCRVGAARGRLSGRRRAERHRGRAKPPGHWRLFGAGVGVAPSSDRGAQPRVGVFPLSLRGSARLAIPYSQMPPKRTNLKFLSAVDKDPDWLRSLCGVGSEETGAITSARRPTATGADNATRRA